MLRTLLRPVDLLLSQLAIRSAPCREMRGLLVSCSDTRVDCEEFFAKCDAALELIRTFDPRRFSRLRRDVRVLGLTTRGSSYYEPRLRAVFLDVDVVRHEPESIAGTIVHEATHARVYWSGVRSYAREAERHERLCVAQEVEFLTRLPNSAPFVEELRRMLDRPWWNEAGRQARIRRFAERHNLPAWLERFLVRFGAR